MVEGQQVACGKHANMKTECGWFVVRCHELEYKDKEVRILEWERVYSTGIFSIASTRLLHAFITFSAWSCSSRAKF